MTKDQEKTMSEDPDKPFKTELDQKLHILMNQPIPKGKRERYLALNKVIERVCYAKLMRELENERDGKSDDDDEMIEALDAAENKLVALGAIPIPNVQETELLRRFGK
jgi:hypothetical protein